MRLYGYCERCRRFRQVSVTGHALASLVAGVVRGICRECEEAEENERRRERP